MSRFSWCGSRNSSESSISLRRARNSRKTFPTIVSVLFVAFLLIGLLAGVGSKSSGEAVAGSGAVLVIPVHDIIDLGLAFFVKRSVESAERDGFEHVLIELDTLGGRVDAALDIRDALEGCKLPVSAYVNKRAISAGALICLSSKDIAMVSGSTIGAATPIGIGPMGGKEQVGEKEISYLRGEFRATAERNGHSPLLAEAMVDPDMEVWAVFEDGVPKIVSSPEVEELKSKYEGLKAEVVSPKDKLLTLTATEALKYGLARSTPATLEDFMRSLGLDPSNMTVAKVSWSENVVRFLTHPIISGLLLTFGVLGIFFELQMPGWGISGTLGTLFLLLFFGGHYLAGLATFLDVLLFVVGLGLIALELFVIPGFGIAGISGILCIFAGIYLALVKRPVPEFSWDYEILSRALLTFIFVFIAVTVGGVVIWKMFPESRLRRAMVLSAREDAAAGYTAGESLEALVGQVGRSLTHLRPSGKALIGGERVEVQTQGEFIERDRPLRVVSVSGNKVVVAEEGAETT